MTFMLLADFGAGAIIAIISAVISITLAVIAAQPPKKGEKRDVFDPGGEDPDPEDRVPIGIGYSWDEPDMLTWWTEPSFFDSPFPSNDEALCVVVESGHGPQDGGAYGLEINDTPHLVEVKDNAPLIERRLVFIGERKVAYFPKSFIDPASVVLRRNGEIFAILGQEANVPEETQYETKKYSGLKGFLDPVSGNWSHSALIIPDQTGGLHQSMKVRVKIQRFAPSGAVLNTYWKDLERVRDYEIYKNTAGQLYIRVHPHIEPLNSTPLGTNYFINPLGSTTRVVEWNLEYKLALTIKENDTFLFRHNTVSGLAWIEFSNPQPNGDEITATYSSNPLGFLVEKDLRWGTGGQEPLDLPNGATPHTSLIDRELFPGVAQRHRTRYPVNEVWIHLRAPEGFSLTEQDGDVEAIGRYIEIRFRSTDAPDVYDINNLDPKAGWVHVHPGHEDLRTSLTGAVVGGPAIWVYKLTTLLTGARERVASTGVVFPTRRLPFDQYEIEIVHVDQVLNPIIPRVKDRVFWEKTTQLTNQAFSLPGRSPHKFRFPVQGQVRRRPKIRERFRRLILKEYDENGNVVEERWSRNGVWAAVEIFLNPHWGLGRLGMTKDNVNWKSAVAGAARCDTLDERGQKMCEADGVFRTPRNAWSALSELLAGAGIAPLFIGGQLTFIVQNIEENPTPVFTLTDAKLYKGRMQTNHPRIEEDYNAFQISYPAENDGDSPLYLPPQEENFQSIRMLEAELPFVRRTHQADREIRRMAVQAVEQKDAYKCLVADKEALLLVPEDIIDVQCDYDKIHGLAAVVSKRVGSNAITELIFRIIKPGLAVDPPIETLMGNLSPAVKDPGFTVASPIAESPVVIEDVEVVSG